MTQNLPRFSIASVLGRLGTGQPADDHAALDAVALVDDMRAREMRLRKWIPAKILRRFDKGFARSNTIQPSTARALYAITRAARADVILETGTYWGYSTAVLAAAARDSGVGSVHTFDLYKHAGQHIPKSLLPWVTMYRGEPATATMPRVLPALPRARVFFQDSVHDYDGVLAELRAASPFLATNSVVLFHDFIVEGVRKAAMDGLPNHQVGLVEVDDPQQLGIALPLSLA